MLGLARIRDVIFWGVIMVTALEYRRYKCSQGQVAGSDP